MLVLWALWPFEKGVGGDQDLVRLSGFLPFFYDEWGVGGDVLIEIRDVPCPFQAPVPCGVADDDQDAGLLPRLAAHASDRLRRQDPLQQPDRRVLECRREECGHLVARRVRSS